MNSHSIKFTAALVLTGAFTSSANAGEPRYRLLELSYFFLEDERNYSLVADHSKSRRDRYRSYHGVDNRDRHYRSGAPRGRDFAYNSYTSPPLRGGSSRRTRIIENPYSDRLVTGITLTGIDDDIVHLKDLVAYPGRYFLSPLGYTLSAYHPPRHINAGSYIDYISVAAKRKEYFTVTFHYD